jgi:hypothetical protein
MAKVSLAFLVMRISVGDGSFRTRHTAAAAAMGQQVTLLAVR